MLTTDTALEGWTHFSPFLNGHAHQLPNAILIQHGKRVLLEDPLSIYMAGT